MVLQRQMDRETHEKSGMQAGRHLAANQMPSENERTGWVLICVSVCVGDYTVWPKVCGQHCQHNFM